MTNGAVRGLATAAAAAFLAGWPAIARACPVCFSADAERAPMYGLVTVIMLGTPALLIGGVGFWVWRLGRSLAAGERRIPGE